MKIFLIILLLPTFLLSCGENANINILKGSTDGQVGNSDSPSAGVFQSLKACENADLGFSATKVGNDLTFTVSGTTNYKITSVSTSDPGYLAEYFYLIDLDSSCRDYVYVEYLNFSSNGIGVSNVSEQEEYHEVMKILGLISPSNQALFSDHQFADYGVHSSSQVTITSQLYQYLGSASTGISESEVQIYELNAVDQNLTLGSDTQETALPSSSNTSCQNFRLDLEVGFQGENVGLKIRGVNGSGQYSIVTALSGIYNLYELLPTLSYSSFVAQGSSLDEFTIHPSSSVDIDLTNATLAKFLSIAPAVGADAIKFISPAAGVFYIVYIKDLVSGCYASGVIGRPTESGASQLGDMVNQMLNIDQDSI